MTKKHEKLQRVKDYKYINKDFIVFFEVYIMTSET